jgi:2-polyprenyl-3-methyl-5-hydroxy-6-metoxy-1,4-benzoquinol methylase
VNTYYQYQRPEVLALVPPGTKRLLDVGCGAGVMAAEAKRRGVSEAYGIEVFQEAGTVARGVLDGVLIGDLESNDIPWNGFDCITCADVLEHLRDPWAALHKLRPLLNERGVLIASIPNIAYWAVVLRILQDDFGYDDEGILDKTHLRFFTRRTIFKMFEQCGFEITKVVKQHSWIKKNQRREMIVRLMSLGILDHCTVFQYLIIARASAPAVS